ncbi:receptor tyrosine kinase, putative [Pediculus humanus corporis]|uniref:receptor protein-tyrosine kinase n=1 Tax=Pediculus humanus subsp. corporis TaxID=121224 RepID=E0W415_PEDHC|nr:receptor tyrosine kinase, putative [Pediculus humanus corporis]EEB20371.1 receptor tyrosine kinase, putative [Pediculus humanus corporis]
MSARVDADLYYVRDGVVNDYALNFVILIPSHISALFFTWQSLAGKALKYNIALQLSNSRILINPKLNISHSGFVPITLQTFTVELPCSGLADAEIDIRLNVTITINKANNTVTHLMFKRRKICLKDSKTTSDDSQQIVLIDTTPAPNIFYIAVGCACALIAVIVTMIIAYYVKTKKIRRGMLQESRNESACSGQGHATFLPVEMANNRTGTSLSSCKSITSYASFKRMPSYSVIEDKQKDKDLSERIAELSIPKCRIRLKSIILEGTFGKVYRGTFAEEDGGEEEIIVKTVLEHASQTQISVLLQEGMSLYNLNHKNILSILGVSIEEHSSPFLVYHYQGYTNLKRFLQKCKVCPEGIAHALTTQEVVDMALQIVHGLQYLHKKKIIHKDIAARNCVVDDKLRVQIWDNALSRDLFPADYHCLGDNENRPIKWLAIESLTLKTFSTASDVWSFGVLLWELTTLAQQPYLEVDPFEMAAYLRDGYRLTQPINCPDELFAVMGYCWAMSIDERPTFTQLNICLQEFYAQLTRYV